MGACAAALPATEEPAFSRSQAIRTSAFWTPRRALYWSSLAGKGVVLPFGSILETGGSSTGFAATVMGIKPLTIVITTILARFSRSGSAAPRPLVATCFM